MNKLLRLIVWVGFMTVLVSSGAHAGTIAHLWSASYGSANDQRARSVTTDASGNIIVTGDFLSTVNFGGGVLTSAGNRDIFVAKFNAAGVHQWSKRFGDTADQYGGSVAVDAPGNIIVTGDFLGTVTFGGANLTTAGSTDIYVAKFSPAGTHQWSKRFGDSNLQYGVAVAADASGNVIITGTFDGTLNFGGSNLIGSGLSGDIYLAKFNSAGVHQWSQRFGDTNGQNGASVATDASENVVLTGYSDGTVNFGGGNLTSAGQSDILLAKFNSAGVHQWSSQFGDASSQTAIDVTTDGGGNILLTGKYAGTVNFGGSNLTAPGFFDKVFLAKFNSAGVHQWSQGFGGDGLQDTYSVAVGPSGSPSITGRFSATIDFGGGTLTAAGFGAGMDIFVAKFNAAGVHQWSQRSGDETNQYGYAIAVDPTENVIATGEFNGTCNFGGANLTSAGGTDTWIAKFGGSLSEPMIADIIDTPNDQGRRVKIRFSRSGQDDAAASLPIQQYEVFRRSDALPASFGAEPVPTAPGSHTIPGWAFVAATPAHAESEYEVFAPTLADSTIAQGQFQSTFFIRAATATPAVFFDSPPDSGYSLDDLAPLVAPGGLVYTAGVLNWAESTAEDLDYYTVYGSDTGSLASYAGGASSVASTTLIGFTTEPTMNVSSSPYVYYLVTATDFAGNEGPPAVINTLTGVGGTPEIHVLSISSYPNPFNPSTTLRYTLPSKGRATIAVYDARGVRVATLSNEEKPAGSYTVPWDGRSDGGDTVSSGVYFARVEFNGTTRAYKMVLLK